MSVSGDPVGYNESDELSRAATQQQGSPSTPAERELIAAARSAGYKGTLPRLATVERFRSAAGMSLGAIHEVFGIDLDRIAWLRAHINVNRTRPAPSRIYIPEKEVWLPSKCQNPEKPYRTAPISSIISEWQHQPIKCLQRWRQLSCLYAQIGLHDGMSYPALPPGAFVQIDPAFTSIAGISDPAYYFVRHPYGYACCRCAVERGRIFLLSSSRLYPQLEFAHPGIVEVVGRVRAFCGKVADIVPPPTITLKQLQTRRVQMLRSPAEVGRPASANELLLNQRLCLGIPYEELNQATVTIHGIAEEFTRFHITNGHAHRIEHEPGFVPTIRTLYALAAYYAIDYSDLLHAYGFPMGEPGDGNQPDHQSEGTTIWPADALAQEEFIAFVLRHWQEWPPLLSHLLPDLPNRKVFFFGGNRGIEPILPPVSFLIVDESRTVEKKPMADRLQEWERPLYLLYTREEGFIAGYAEREHKKVILLPHARAADHRERHLLCPEQVEIIGRITHVATLL